MGRRAALAISCPLLYYNPSFPALFSRNRLHSRIYLRTIWTDRCPVWFMMLRSLAPPIAAEVACPARRQCPHIF